jgi:hypothetical protein
MSWKWFGNELEMSWTLCGIQLEMNCVGEGVGNELDMSWKWFGNDLEMSWGTKQAMPRLQQGMDKCGHAGPG